MSSSQYPVAELDARNQTADAGPGYPVGLLAFLDVATSSDGSTTPLAVPEPGHVAPGPAPYSGPALAYFTNSSDGTVSVYDVASKTVTKTITVGGAPNRVVFNKACTKAYVASENSSVGVTIIDVASGTVDAAIPIGTAVRGLALSKDEKTIYAGIAAGIDLVDLASQSVTATISTPGTCYDIAVSLDGSTLFTADYNSTTCTVVDVASKTATHDITVGSYPQSIAMAPDGSAVYVATYGDGNVVCIDTTTLAVRYTTRVGSSLNDVAVSPDGATLYCPNYINNGVYVVSAVDGSSAHATLSCPDYAMTAAVSSDGKTLYVGTSAASEVDVYDITNSYARTTIATGATPMGIALTS